MIDKIEVRVGGVDSVDPDTQLPMFRQYITFEGNRSSEFIRVYYNQYLKGANGSILNFVSKCYLVQNLPEKNHIGEPDVNGDSTVIIDTPANTGFTDWFFLPIVAKADGLYINGNKYSSIDAPLCLGRDIIVGAINYTLKMLPHNVADNHTTIRNT